MNSKEDVVRKIIGQRVNILCLNDNPSSIVKHIFNKSLKLEDNDVTIILPSEFASDSLVDLGEYVLDNVVVRLLIVQCDVLNQVCLFVSKFVDSNTILEMKDFWIKNNLSQFVLWDQEPFRQQTEVELLEEVSPFCSENKIGLSVAIVYGDHRHGAYDADTVYESALKAQRGFSMMNVPSAIIDVSSYCKMNGFIESFIIGNKNYVDCELNSIDIRIKNALRLLDNEYLLDFLFGSKIENFCSTGDIQKFIEDVDKNIVMKVPQLVGIKPLLPFSYRNTMLQMFGNKSLKTMSQRKAAADRFVVDFKNYIKNNLK